MQVKFSKRKGERINNQFDWIDIIQPFGNDSLWFEHSSATWVKYDDRDKKSVISSCHSFGDPEFPRTLKALMNYVQRHSELSGCVIHAFTRYEGHSVTIKN